MPCSGTLHPFPHGLGLASESVSEPVGRLELFAKLEAFALLIP